jgi:hypothetical protein
MGANTRTWTGADSRWRSVAGGCEGVSIAVGGSVDWAVPPGYVGGGIRRHFEVGLKVDGWIE